MFISEGKACESDTIPIDSTDRKYNINYLFKMFYSHPTFELQKCKPPKRLAVHCPHPLILQPYPLLTISDNIINVTRIPFHQTIYDINILIRDHKKYYNKILLYNIHLVFNRNIVFSITI